MCLSKDDSIALLMNMRCLETAYRLKIKSIEFANWRQVSALFASCGNCRGDRAGVPGSRGRARHGALDCRAANSQGAGRGGTGREGTLDEWDRSAK